MKIEEDEKGKSTVHIDDHDYVFIINVKDRHSAIHWPVERPPGEDIIKLIYHLAHVNMKINDRAIDMGLTPEEIKTVTMAAWEDYIKDEDSDDGSNGKDTAKYESGFVVSGNSTVH